jgi:biotin transporter BioY
LVTITGNTNGGTGVFTGPSSGFTTDYSSGSKATLNIGVLSGKVNSDTLHHITYTYTHTIMAVLIYLIPPFMSHKPVLSYTIKSLFNIEEGVTA